MSVKSSWKSNPVSRSKDEIVERARARLFGNWEMNWMAYNYAHDLLLPQAARGKIAFLMYPQGETVEGRLDSLDPEHLAIPWRLVR